MMNKMGNLEKEARRLQAGRRRRRLTVDLGGAALEGWEALESMAKTKAVDIGGVLTLLILHGGTRVKEVLDKLPTPPHEGTQGKEVAQ